MLRTLQKFERQAACMPSLLGMSAARMYSRQYAKSVGGTSSYEVPNFQENLKPNRNSDANRNLSYFMIGSFGLVSAITARNTVQDFLTTMSASKDVLALAKVEVDLANIPVGKNIVVKWRGKPVFVRHRSKNEIEEANSVDVKSLRDPQEDKDRAKTPEWLVMIGICTHLGCVPIGESGDFGGWFCPCHGSHYDISGRIRKGPAPLNLEIPEYTLDGDTLTVG